MPLHQITVSVKKTDAHSFNANWIRHATINVYHKIFPYSVFEPCKDNWKLCHCFSSHCLPAGFALHHMLSNFEWKLYPFHEQLRDSLYGFYAGFKRRQTDIPTGAEESHRPGKEPQDKKPDNRPKNIHVFFSFFTDLYSVTVKTKKEIVRSLHVKNGLKHYNVGLKARRFRRCSHVIRFCRENGDLFSPVWSTDRMYSTNMVTENSSFQKRLPERRVLKTPFQLYQLVRVDENGGF